MNEPPSASLRFSLCCFFTHCYDYGNALRKSTYGNILMFEIGTNDVLEIPCTFDKFLNEEIPLYADVC